MLLPLVVFVFVVVLIMATYVAMTSLPAIVASRQMDRRLRDVSAPPIDEPVGGDRSSVVRQDKRGPLPAIDRLFSHAPIGAGLKRLIERSGMETTPSAIIMAAVGLGTTGFFIALFTASQPFVPWIAALVGFIAPFAWLKRRASVRLKRFEEQFPEALDLLSRAIRAGHSFQTAMGMVASELPSPVGPEFKKTFDQQNFGLPLKEALGELAERVALLDVRFFVTAVLIQRDTGGNLAEILDNLASVVRDRFKILRQIRVHTAHGRFTGYVLLALPAALTCVLLYMNPEFMSLLFNESMGKMMVIGAIILQTIGFFWIRRVIKIEV